MEDCWRADYGSVIEKLVPSEDKGDGVASGLMV